MYISKYNLSQTMVQKFKFNLRQNQITVSHSHWLSGLFTVVTVVTRDDSQKDGEGFVCIMKY